MKEKHLTVLGWGLMMTGVAIIVSTLNVANEASRTQTTSGANASALMSIVHRISPTLDEIKKEPTEAIDENIAETLAIPTHEGLLKQNEPVLTQPAGHEASLKK